MLQSFLSLRTPGESSSIKTFFENCRIGEDKEFLSQNFRKYPVILLSLKDCVAPSWQTMKMRLWRCIRQMFLPHLAQLSQVEQLQEFNFMSLIAPGCELMEGSLMLLTELLYFNNECKRVVVLIDEYDAPLNCAFQNGFEQEASDFFSNFFSSALKDNIYLEKACLMGIVEVNGAHILSTLNNLFICSVDKSYFSEHFGFSLEEAREFLGNDESILSGVLKWYDGYTIGATTVINPWSFMSYIVVGQLRSYWTDTSFTATIRAILQPHIKVALLVTFRLLFEVNPVPTPLLSSKVDYSSVSMSVTSILHFLVHTGYLSYTSHDGCTGYVRIPNYEVREHWREHVVNMVRDTVFLEASVSQARLQEALLASPFEKTVLEDIMHGLMYSSISRFDTISENSYHCFFLGCFSTAFDGVPGVKVKSNRESGMGRFDIIIAFEGVHRVFIFELKKAATITALKSKATQALKQALVSDYAAEFHGFQCFLIGVSFFHEAMSKFQVKVVDG
jgi:hypothetical protein